MFDVAVVGAGPAGAAAALAAARSGARVALLDRDDFPRDKVCGDGIAAQAVDVAESLGVTGLTDGYRPLRTLALTGPRGSAVSRPMPRLVHTIPRQVFDHRLVTAAVAQGAEFIAFQVSRVTPRPDHVDLDGVKAKVVIGADGAQSVVRRALGFPANPPGHVAIAFRGYAAAEPGDDVQRILMTDRGWPAYAWSFPIGDGRRNVGYGEVLTATPTARAELLARMSRLLPDVDLSTVELLRAHHLPLSTRRPPPGAGRVLLAGDALSLINPFTGEGIFYALASGALAGAAAVHGPAALPHYRRALRARLGRHLRHTSLVSRLSRSPSIVDRGIRGATRSQQVFDDLVELGLGDGLITPRVLLSLTHT